MASGVGHSAFEMQEQRRVSAGQRICYSSDSTRLISAVDNERERPFSVAGGDRLSWVRNGRGSREQAGRRALRTVQRPDTARTLLEKGGPDLVLLLSDLASSKLSCMLHLRVDGKMESRAKSKQQ
jgi:hypothetical protein